MRYFTASMVEAMHGKNLPITTGESRGFINLEKGVDSKYVIGQRHITQNDYSFLRGTMSRGLTALSTHQDKITSPSVLTTARIRR